MLTPAPPSSGHATSNSPSMRGTSTHAVPCSRLSLGHKSTTVTDFIRTPPRAALPAPHAARRATAFAPTPSLSRSSASAPSRSCRRSPASRARRTALAGDRSTARAIPTPMATKMGGPLQQDRCSGMRCDSQHSKLTSCRTVAPEDAICRRRLLFGVGFEDLFSVRSLQTDVFVSFQAWMSGIRLQVSQRLSNGLEALGDGRGLLKFTELLISLGSEPEPKWRPCGDYSFSSSRPSSAYRANEPRSMSWPCSACSMPASTLFSAV